MREFVYPLLFSFVAGLSTVLGALIAIFLKADVFKKLYKLLAFSAGVMACISIVSLMADAFIGLSHDFDSGISFVFVFASISVGVLLSRVLDRVVDKKATTYNLTGKREMKTAFFIMIAIIAHNFPEGIITFISSVNDLHIGAIVTLGIMLHNIPEGIALASPIYYATKSKKKAIMLTFFSGMSEPIGAIFAMLFLRNFLSETVMSIVLAFVAGIMLDVAFMCLLKDSVKSIGFRKSILWFIIGFVFLLPIMTHTHSHSH
ncbi:MAG: ZIP family metal transporter [Oscillospiraceae bacterium]